MPDQDDFDRLLDSALSSYSEAAPGLEQLLLSAIVHRHAAISVTRKNHELLARRLRWAIALPVAACLLIAMAVFLHRSQSHVSPTLEARTPPAPHLRLHAAPLSPVPRRVLHHQPVSRPHAVLAAVRAAPKCDVFPTPQPLTPDEQAFVRYVAAAPQKERRALIEARAQQDAPLEISAIRIKPITVPGQTGNQGEP